MTQVPVNARSSWIFFNLSVILPSTSPSSYLIAETSEVNSETPGPRKEAPHPTTPPTTLSVPIIAPTDSSGIPFCNVHTTLLGPKWGNNCFKAISLYVCFASKITISYIPSIWSGVIALTGILFSCIFPLTVAPFSFKAATCALFVSIRIQSPPFLAIKAPIIVPSEPTPIIAVFIKLPPTYFN